MKTYVRIATVCQARRYEPTIEQNRARVMGLLDEALRGQPDLVCLPETFVTAGIPFNKGAITEPVPGPTTDAAAERARRGRCYVICPLFTLRDGIVRNSAVVLDRSGAVVGIYDKQSPVTGSYDYTIMETGVVPGNAPNVFDLDFGKIGIQICFDIGFPERWQQMQAAGARLVVWPSAYNGGYPLEAYAALHGYYVVTAVNTERSKIIDPCGDVVAQTDAEHQVIARAINLDYAVCHMDFNYGIPDRIAAEYGSKVAIRRHEDAGLVLIEPHDPELSMAALQRQFGFESRTKYIDRHRQAYKQISAGKAAQAQAAPHGNRPMWGL